MRRVLLVDDDVAVLDGLRKALRSHRDWTIEVAGDGRAALEILGRRPFDAVVSDAHMPGIDGEELLKEVIARWPSTLRVILSGQVRYGAAERLAGLTQQLIPKPVKPGTLYLLIEGALKAREKLANPELRSLVGQLGKLPALPPIFGELCRILDSPDYQLRDVVALVQKDPGISANVLKLVNSVWFGPPVPVLSLRDAVKSVGANTLRSLVLAAGVFSGTSEFAQFLMQEAMARQAFVQALATRRKDHQWLDAAVTASIVCDVARLMLAQARAGDFERCEALVRDGAERLPTEGACFGADHALLGSVLLGEWGLPAGVVDAVALHHDPPREVCAATAVALASAAVERANATPMLEDLAVVFGLTIDELSSLRGALPQ